MKKIGAAVTLTGLFLFIFWVVGNKHADDVLEHNRLESTDGQPEFAKSDSTNAKVSRSTDAVVEGTRSSTPLDELEGLDPLGKFTQDFDRFVDSDPDERYIRLSMTIREAVREGLAFQVLEKIESKFGPGRVRSHLLSICFSGITQPELAKPCFTSLNDEEDKAAATKGISEMLVQVLSVSEGVGSNMIADFSFAGELGSVKTTVASNIAIADHLNRQSDESSGDRFNDSLEKIANLRLTDEEQKDFLKNVAATVPFESWEVIKNARLATDDDLKFVAQKMADQNPAGAVEALVQSDRGASAIRNVMEYWLSHDARTPFEWFEQNSKRMDEEKANLARAAIVDFSVLSRTQDFGAARAWASTVNDSELNRELLDKIQKAENQILGKAAVRDEKSND